MNPAELIRRALVTAAVVGAGLGAVALDVAPAHALQQTPQYYQLTPRERRNACGSFIGTIIFSDGTSLDCYTGVAQLY
jgi:hypothetical protein